MCNITSLGPTWCSHSDSPNLLLGAQDHGQCATLTTYLTETRLGFKVFRFERLLTLIMFFLSIGDRAKFGGMGLESGRSIP